jgi:Zn-dependent protease with chaperone function
MLFALLLILHFLASAAVVYGMDQLSLIPWRRAKEAHWTQRARLLWPVRKSSALLFVAAPALLAVVQLIVLPHLPPAFLWAAVAGLPGAAIGTWPMAHALFPGLTMVRWLRDLTSAIVIRLLMLGIYLAAGAFMPYEMGFEMLALTLIVVGLTLWVIRGGLLWMLWAIGSLLPPPERLVHAVNSVAERMKLPVPKLYQLRTYGANALAYPLNHTLLVTEGALKALSDEELGAVCAHEFAHLNEPRKILLMRGLSAFALLPAIFLKPIIEAWGPAGCLMIGVLVLMVARLTTHFRRRMEVSADAVATTHEGESPGVYARALERIYEINHIPAVLAGALTHPNLYDRLEASGVTPAYPRPAPPPRFSWQYGLILLLLAISVFTVITRLEAMQGRQQRAHPPTVYMDDV